ncbi:MAG: hypothetical protein LBR98_07760 [Syntrophomonadaceae bacterium]|nr:hypothetical protein [Syntrophomonadaceae bacterium]
MLLKFAERYDQEIFLLQKELEAALYSWWPETEDKYNAVKEDFTFKMLPVFSLALDDYLCIDRAAALSLANIVRIYYFGQYAHETVVDDDEFLKNEKDFQFAILLGDYIQGKVLRLLNEAGLDMLLKIFSDMIADLNEGLVEKYRGRGDYAEVLDKTKRPYYAALTLSAAIIARQSEERKTLFKDLGVYFGMAAELIAHGKLLEKADWCIFQCETIFAQINENSPYINSALEQAVRGLRKSLDDLRTKAATV